MKLNFDNAKPFSKVDTVAPLVLLTNVNYEYVQEYFKPKGLWFSKGSEWFDWCESNQTHFTTWRDYCYIKYPISISFEDT